MSGESQFGSHYGPIACSEFDRLRSDAVDGALSGEPLEQFNAHAAACQACGASFAEAREGIRWLRVLGNVEAPERLLHNILARTSHAEPFPPAARAAAPAQGWPLDGLRKLLSGSLQPRFAATFGMAFFSLSLMFNMAGFKPGGMRAVELSPPALYRLASREYYSASARFVRYYENTRFVYEMEFKVQELREAAGEEDESKPNKISMPQDTSRSRNPDRTGGSSPQNSLVSEAGISREQREPRQASVAEVALPMTKSGDPSGKA